MIKSDDFQLLSVSKQKGIASAIICNPPINLFSGALLLEMESLLNAIEKDPEVAVLIFRSGDPDFFIAHFDLSPLAKTIADGKSLPRSSISPRFQRLCMQLGTMDVISICQIDGRVGGGGSEFAMACDMRFGAVGQTVINQMEVPLGIIPAGSGTQLMPRLIGYARAAEMILAGVDVDAITAERWGYLNRALPPDDLAPYVNYIAARIASFPRAAVQLAKQCMRNALSKHIDEGLLSETQSLDNLLGTITPDGPITKFLASGGQTREGELHINDLSGRLH